MKNCAYFINTLYQLDYSNLKAIDNLIDDIASHLAEHGSDSKLELALHVTKVRKLDELNSGFDKVCEAAKFVVDKLKDQADWDIDEFNLFCSVLGRIQSYELTLSMMEKSLNVLERNFKNLPNYEYMKARIFGEMTWRLMRAKFHDNVDPQELTKLFDTCVNSAMQVCEKSGRVALRTNLLVRQAIFNGNPDEVLECVKAMEATEDKYWIKSSKDEVVEYVRFLSPNVTNDLHKFVVGWQIQKRRKELGMGTQKLADMVSSTQPAINAIERGEKGVRPERLYVFMYALQVQNPSYFFGEPLVSARVIPKDTYDYQMVQLMSGMSEKKKKLALTLAKGIANDDDE